MRLAHPLLVGRLVWAQPITPPAIQTEAERTIARANRAIEQLLNGFSSASCCFMAAGLTLIRRHGLINLAHGSLYMIGAAACAIVAAQTFVLARPDRKPCSRSGRRRDHRDPSSGGYTSVITLIRCWRPCADPDLFEGTRWLFGSFPLYLDIPPLLGNRAAAGRLALPALSPCHHWRRRVAVGLFF